MKEHLTSQQIEKWMIGERTPAGGAHLRNCPECAAKLASVSGPVKLFGAAVRNWSERHNSGQFSRPVVLSERPAGWRPWRVALACAAVAVIMAIPVFRPVRTLPPAGPVSTTVSDEALLRQVDLEVSRSVPGPMEPLAYLMTSDSEGESSGQKNVTRKAQ